MTVRDRFSTFASRWATLTEEQRVGWNSLAALVTKTGKYGDLYTPTGHRLYIALNQTRAEFGLAILDDAPLGIEPTDSTGRVCSYGERHRSSCRRIEAGS
jgi:hypothetical protein